MLTSTSRINIKKFNIFLDGSICICFVYYTRISVLTLANCKIPVKLNQEIATADWSPRAPISRTSPLTPDAGCPRRQEPSGDTPEKTVQDAEEVFRSISILNRTRESLSASASPGSNGQLLDRALAKQLAVRKAELDSLLPNSVSVIVRTSTPDPNLSCEDSFFPHSHNQSHSYPPTPQFPDYNSLPLRVPPLSRHPVLHLPGGVAGRGSSKRERSRSSLDPTQTSVRD